MNIDGRNSVNLMPPSMAADRAEVVSLFILLVAYKSDKEQSTTSLEGSYWSECKVIA